MVVEPEEARHRAEHAGQSYFFCSAKCREKFAADPARYVVSSPDRRGPIADEVLWTCPMHPQIVRKEPGNCPICGMTLEPMTPTAGDAVSPELRDMTWRFWVGVALSVPLLAIAAGARAWVRDREAPGLRCSSGNGRVARAPGQEERA